MASIDKNNGSWRIRFRDADGEQKAVRPGSSFTKRQVESIARHIEELRNAAISGQPMARTTATWLADIGKPLRRKLVKAGLIEDDESRRGMMIGPFIENYIASHRGKVSTKTKWTTTKNHLLGFFDVSTPLMDINKGHADQFRQYLYDKGQRENTVRRSCGIAKQFFRSAVRQELVPTNPFEDQTTTMMATQPDQFHFVTQSDTERLLQACPDMDWRVIIALVRHGGLRCPSEVLLLKWSDIDWDVGGKLPRMNVTSPKTEHHEGGQSRVVPLFPKLALVLREARGVAGDSELVVNRYHSPSQNLRTTFAKIVKRAGLMAWKKPFQNMRSSRQTELVDDFPKHVVSSWMGNSEAVAEKHYLQTTDVHFLRAVSESPNTPEEILSTNLSTNSHETTRKATK